MSYSKLKPHFNGVEWDGNNTKMPHYSTNFGAAILSDLENRDNLSN